MRATVCTFRKAGDLCVHARLCDSMPALVCIRTRNSQERITPPHLPCRAPCTIALLALSRTPRNVPVAAWRTCTEGPLWLQPPARNRCFVLSCYRDSQVLTKWHGAISWTFLVVKPDTASPNRPPNPDPGIFHRSLSWEVRAKELWRQGFRGGTCLRKRVSAVYHR